MIGQLPSRLRPLGRKRRTLPYTLPRTARKRVASFARAAHGPRSVDTGGMLFDRSNDLPQATVVLEPRSFLEYVGEGIKLWLHQHWRWLRPRAIPVVVALAGMGITIAAVNQLSKPPPQIATHQPVLDGAPGAVYQPGRIRIVLQQ